MAAWPRPSLQTPPSRPSSSRQRDLLPVGPGQTAYPKPVEDKLGVDGGQFSPVNQGCATRSPVEGRQCGGRCQQGAPLQAMGDCEPWRPGQSPGHTQICQNSAPTKLCCSGFWAVSSCRCRGAVRPGPTVLLTSILASCHRIRHTWRAGCILNPLLQFPRACSRFMYPSGRCYTTYFLIHAGAVSGTPESKWQWLYPHCRA